MSDWETVGSPAAADDGWETVGAAKPPPQPPLKLWQKAIGFLPETVASLASGAVAGPVSGFAGLAGSMLPGPPGQGAEWVQKAQEELTYTPRTQAAQKLVGLASWPGEKIAQAGEWAGGHAAELTGSPAVGAGINTAVNALPFAVGAGVKKMIPSGATEGQWAARNAARIKNMQADEALARAKEAGLAVPTTQTSRPGRINSTLEWYAGKPQTAQVASVKNQPKLQGMVRGDFDLPPTSMLDKPTYDFVRSEAGKAYEAVKGTGESPVSHEYTNTLTSMSEPFEKRARYYPDDPPPPIIKEIDSVFQPTLNADAAIEKIKDLRNEANKVGSGERPDKAYAAQLRELANVVENEVELHLERTGQPPEMIQNYRDARKVIAKAHTAEEHTTPSGEINAVSMARELKKGDIGENMRTVAHFGADYPRAAQLPTRVGGGPSSAFEAIGSIMSPKKEVLSAILGRHKLRDVLTSDFWQRHMVKSPTYGGTMGDAIMRGMGEPATPAFTQGLALSDDERKRAMLEQLLR